MTKDQYANALAKFKNMRGNLLSLLSALRLDGYLKFIRVGDVFSFILDSKFSDSVLFGQGHSGCQISFPLNLLPIAECEYHSLHIYKDGIVFVCKSLNYDEGDNRVIHICFPTTYALAQYLKTQKEIDIGSYEFNEDYSIKYKSLQYLAPKDVDDTLFVESLSESNNWLQQTLSGNEFITLEDNGIEIPINAHEYADKHKGKPLDLDEHAEICGAMLSISAGEAKSALIGENKM